MYSTYCFKAVLHDTKFNLKNGMNTITYPPSLLLTLFWAIQQSWPKTLNAALWHRGSWDWTHRSICVFNTITDYTKLSIWHHALLITHLQCYGWGVGVGLWSLTASIISSWEQFTTLGFNIQVPRRPPEKKLHCKSQPSCCQLMAMQCVGRGGLRHWTVASSGWDFTFQFLFVTPKQHPPVTTCAGSISTITLRPFNMFSFPF